MARTGQPRLEELSPRAAAAAVRRQLDATDLRAFVRSSPARLIAIGLLLVGLCAIAGAVTASAVGSRQEALDHLLNQSEPDANSAQHLYTSLSVADAAAGTAFISGGLEPKQLRDRYDQALGEASAELVTQSSSTGAADPDGRLRSRIATGLPVYAGLVETARANNREGHPVGAAYLSEASNLMQTRLLPTARELQENRSAAILDTQRSHVRPPWAAIVLPIVALSALVVAQLYLARRWHRMLNPGLLLASATLLALLSWTVIAGSLSALSTMRGRDDGSVPTADLTEGRILVQQARTAETLKLVRRDASGDYDHTYDASTAKLTRLLTDYPGHAPGAEDVATARGALDRWREAHRRMNDTLGRGDFLGAGAVAIGPGAGEATASVDALDTALADGIAKTRHTLRANVSEAARALDVLAPGALVLSLLAAVFVLAGLWPRLREYR
ncbi:hypothetical protein NDR87_28110 [Nocardia sp. CDC159]|uniref:Secreted protein n=1 Tax=Nocardia pulmonis TaxID=2951408 RepID=A0A9X2EFQ0_9NOCA|nr:MULTISPECIES: hypothetical protein [Nocardia]MCM6777358.1 hypothetical protein [Nocardia pulmonis]MCM6790243.1 hypothetical protein [Nocardia sp. CDC159]